MTRKKVSRKGMDGAAGVDGVVSALLRVPKSRREEHGLQHHADFVRRYPKLFRCVCDDDDFDVAYLKRLTGLLRGSSDVATASDAVTAELQRKYLLPVLAKLPVPGGGAPGGAQ